MDTVHHDPSHKNSSILGFFSRNKAGIAAIVAYIFIALIIFWPVSANINGTIAGTGGDPYQSMWNLWWVPYSTFTLHQSFWTTNLLFWPVGANLIYETLMPIGAMIVAPFQAVSPMLAYNILFFIGIVLSGFGMYVLSDYIVKNKYAAFIAGIIFTFSAFHIAQSYGHLDYANLEWIPLSIYMLLRIVNRDYLRIKYGKYASAVVLAVFFLLGIFMGEIEQGIITLMALLLITLAFAISKNHRKIVISREFAMLVIVFLVSATIIGSWAFIPIVKGFSSSVVNQLNDVYHNEIWSDDLLSFFVPPYYNGIFNGAAQSYSSIYHQDISETTSYIGYVALVLAAYGIYKTRKTDRQVYLWTALGVVFFLLALGPYILVDNSATVPGPYLVIKAIPILNVLREPGRFDMIVTVATAILAAFGVKELFNRISRRSSTGMARNSLIAITAVITFLILIETATPPLSASLAANMTTTPAISQFYMLLGQHSNNFSILQLPALPNQYSVDPALYPAEDMFSTIFTHKPILGGYLSRENVTQQSPLYNIPLVVDSSEIGLGFGPGYISVVNQSFVNQSLLGLYLYNTTIVTLDRSAYNGTTLPEELGYMESIFGAPQYYSTNDNIIGWSTVNAVGTSVFKSYVTFPSVSSWNASIYSLNGSNVTLWKPIGDGLLFVYAPYINGDYNSASYLDNTTVSVSAISLGSKSSLGVGELTNSGISELAVLNITGADKNYNFTTRLQPGIYGNGLVFQFSNSSLQNNAAGIVSIRFSKRG